MEEERKSCLALGFRVRKIHEKEEGGSISPLYRVEHENSLAIRLKPFAINGLDCPRVSTTKIKSPFEI